MKKITIPYFPKGLKYVSPFLVIGGIALWIIGYPIWMGVLTLLAIILLTTNYVTEINSDRKEYRDYLSFLGIPFDEEKEKYNALEKIIVQKERHSQRLNSWAQSRQFDWESYTATLIFDNGKTLDLVTKTSKRDLIMGLKLFSEFLKVDIEDQTTSRHYIVDLARVE